jgi:PhzF family phenazine biosynthesis protein
MSIPIHQVDAFTSEPFAGNPAAVTILEKKMPDEWMAGLAREMNLSETAFLLKGRDAWSLRWFTPGAEVNLCGHATLASAHILWEQGYLPSDQSAVFNTRSGLLSAVKKNDWIEMDFPAYQAVEAPLDGQIQTALGGEPQEAFATGEDLLVVYSNTDEIISLKPKIPLVAKMPFRGVCVSAKGDGKPYDFVSRFFAPQVGVDEDPVTGSAHSSLCPFWAARLGKTEMLAKQVSARGGVIRVRDMGERVAIAGQAVTLFTGELRV